jgi:hypothetical protein
MPSPDARLTGSRHLLGIAHAAEVVPIRAARAVLTAIFWRVVPYAGQDWARRPDLRFSAEYP